MFIYSIKVVYNIAFLVFSVKHRTVFILRLNWKKKCFSSGFLKKGRALFLRYFRLFYYCHLGALFKNFYLLPGISWSPSLIDEKVTGNTNLFLLIHVLTLSPLKRTKPPMRIHVPSTACDGISFNGQRQLCLLTCAGWRDVSNHTRMSTIQSRRPEKKAKHNVTLTWKFPWNSSSAILPFIWS